MRGLRASRVEKRAMMNPKSECRPAAQRPVETVLEPPETFMLQSELIKALQFCQSNGLNAAAALLHTAIHPKYTSEALDTEIVYDIYEHSPYQGDLRIYVMNSLGEFVKINSIELEKFYTSAYRLPLLIRFAFAGQDFSSESSNTPAMVS